MSPKILLKTLGRAPDGQRQQESILQKLTIGIHHAASSLPSPPRVTFAQPYASDVSRSIVPLSHV